MEENKRFRLNPRQYLKLQEPLIFFLPDHIALEDFERLRDALAQRKTPLVFGGYIAKRDEEWRFKLQLPAFAVETKESGDKNLNLFCEKFQKPDDGINGYYNDYRKQLFLVEAAEGCLMIYRQVAYRIDPWEEEPVTKPEHADWSMTDEGFLTLRNKMISYFSGAADKVNSYVNDAVNDHVLRPFDIYTQQEYDYEAQKVDFTKALQYSSREVGGVSVGKKTTYLFFSQDQKYDPDEPVFVPGNRLSIYREDKTAVSISGLLVEVDTDSRDGIVFVLECYQQFDLEQLPESGYLSIAPNNTQLKIRRKVSQNIRYGETPATYMYHTFDDFYVEDYEKPADHPKLIPFLQERLGSKYPPNQMQLEAIVKGVLTEDLLLVLGPPGTGKTTVILSWLDYFIANKKRVLISSQNNAAVDNVLERCNPNYEIVRLGRSAKVQENCRQFLPENRIASMRRACEENSLRLETQLQEECRQIQAYRETLLQQQELLHEKFCISVDLSILRDQIQFRGEMIRDYHRLLKNAAANLENARVSTEKYRIFIEESNRRNILVRLLQSGLRRVARKKLEAAQATISKAQEKLVAARADYERQVQELQALLAEVREKKLLPQWQEILEKTQAGNQLVIDRMPVFASELGQLQILEERPQFSDTTKVDTEQIQQEQEQIQQELERMDQVLEAAEKIRAAAKAWADAVKEDQRNDIFQEILLEACQVVGATCVGINSNKSFATVDFDVAIIDESGQIQVHNALIPMSRAPKALMLGDYKQIPPIVNNDILATLQLDGSPTELYEKSFFQYLFEQMRAREIGALMKKYYLLGFAKEDLPKDEEEKNELLRNAARKKILEATVKDYIGKPLESTVIDEKGETKPQYHCRYTEEELKAMVKAITYDRKKLVNLNSQFRMPGQISDVISQWFYESNYFSSYDEKNFVPVVPGTDKPLVLIDTGNVAGRFETQPASKMGYHNQLEAKIVAKVLEAVLSPMSREEQNKYKSQLGNTLGIISAYGAQVRMIRQTLQQKLDLTAAQAETAVASLDSFQGQERDLIIYSLTRSDRKSRNDARVGFLKELRRLNVAFTRSKKQLVVIGDLQYLQECLYVEDTDESLPCANTKDDHIDETQILQCAECKLDCERRFARFFRLLMQHAIGENAGNVYRVKEIREQKGGG